MNQNGNAIAKEKSSDDIEVIMLSKQSTKRKRKSANEENIGSKLKNKRYRRGNVADEVPTKIILDDDEEEEDHEEEPGEILDDDQQSAIKPHKYTLFNEEQILSSKRNKFSFDKNEICFSFRIEKFKRPADDEDIYDPNRAKKATKVKVNPFDLIVICDCFCFILHSRIQNDQVLNKPTNHCPIHFLKRLNFFLCFFLLLLLLFI